MLINGAPINSTAINSAVAAEGFVDWTLEAPTERTTIYIFEIDGNRFPISSAQASMRLTGQSYLQAIVPAGDQYIDLLATLTGLQMELKKGFIYEAGAYSPLEVIATAPFQALRRDQGSTNDTLTLDGYGALPEQPSLIRTLEGVRFISTAASGLQRVRCDIDLFLRPGHVAANPLDGSSFTVGTIQYFINSSSDFMEVIQDG